MLALDRDARAIEFEGAWWSWGRLADVADTYDGAAENLQTVWVAVRASLRSVLDDLTLDDVVEGRLPQRVKRLTEQPDAWSRR